MDAGCEYHGYSSDITRTFPINGKFSPGQKDIYNIVLKANEACIAMCKPNSGDSLQSINRAAAKIMQEELAKLGIIGGKNVSNL
jgi:Xaa-Pro aminopeptidase